MMEISEITNLINSYGQTGVNPGETDEDKIIEAFKKIFTEKMIEELMKTGNLLGGVDGLQKDIYEQHLKESLGQYFMDGAGIRWNEVLGLNKAEVKDEKSDDSNGS